MVGGRGAAVRHRRVDAAAAGWVWRRRGAVGAASLTALLAAAAVWCASYGLELVTVGRATREFWGSVEYLGTTVLPVAWLAFVLEYTGRREQLTPRLLGVLAVEPVLVLLLLTNPGTHDLIRSFPPGPVPFVPVVDLGPVYWVHFVYTTALAALGIVLLVTRLLRVSSLYRRQSVTLVVAVMLPLLGNTASSPGWARRTYDPPIAVSLSGLVLVWGAFRYRLLDLLPARTLAFDRLGDPVLVVDVYGRVVDRNPAAARPRRRRHDRRPGAGPAAGAGGAGERHRRGRGDQA
jgi:hypothetical protein